MKNSMDKIEHIVYVMLENRSLDNVLGWVHDAQNPPKLNLPPQNPPTYEGLKENTFYNFDKHGKKHWVTKGTNGSLVVPSFDPFEEYEHVNNQLFVTGTEAPENNPTPGTKASMGGFYKDFYTLYDSAYQILQTYTPEELPIINGLAKSFGVSDGYFSSVPTQTNCNRAFAATGNSLGINEKNELVGWVNNHFGSLLHPKHIDVTFNQRTLWNVLADNHYNTPNDWMVFYHKVWTDYCYTRDLLDQIQDEEFDPNFDTIQTFYDKAESGTLPRFSFLEPAWGLKKWKFGTNGNDYHPPCNLAPGEEFLNKIYQALTANKAAWDKTLLIINFDEHGGTYDHVSPAWYAPTPWANRADGTAKPKSTEFDFGFDRYGVRVPLLAVSPYVPEGLVFRANPGKCLDHCSVIATVLKHFKIDPAKWQLGSRVAQAETFEHALALSTPRADIPRFTPPTLKESEQDIDPPFNDLQAGIANRVLKFAAKRKASNSGRLQSAHEAHFGDHVETVSELSKALHQTLQSMHPETV